MIRIGLTGSIASGKSEVVRLLRERGWAVFDADATVHQLYEDGTVANILPEELQSAVKGEIVSRSALSELLAAKPSLLAMLESRVHPLVRSRENMFFRTCNEEGMSVAFADIPLLYEQDRDHDFDRIVLVHAPASIRRQRALQRPGMTETKLQFIMAKQLSDAAKLARADIILDNTGSLAELAGKVDMVLHTLRQRIT